tara:strand:- start:146 stop:313 length:168 start_codon:yes stop_codon:yes gene_type:complete
MDQDEHNNEDAEKPATYLIFVGDNIIRTFAAFSVDEAKKRMALMGLVGTLALVVR